MNYQELACHSRVWIYQADRKLTKVEVGDIRSYGAKFIDQWAAHGSDLQAAFEVFYNQFIVLFADESQVKASGCSIDSSVRFIKDIEQLYQLDLFNRLNLTYKDDSEIKMLVMADFQKALEEGVLNEETTVFNNLIETKEDFVSKWEVPVKSSWHVNLITN
ncbi:ABC transporter ATPase [Vicingaceae bacterium]|nr:ABC transporter ATPase [Vicingaceae bacterium]MDC1452300.1 ABC transporter ATPase [Vicingaceae bacterium]